MLIRGYFLSAIRNTQYDIRDAIVFPAFFAFFNHGLHRFRWLSFSGLEKKIRKFLTNSRGGGNPDDIAVAENLKAEGNTAKAIGGSQIGDVALDKYEEAWEKAVGSW